MNKFHCPACNQPDHGPRPLGERAASAASRVNVQAGHFEIELKNSSSLSVKSEFVMSSIPATAWARGVRLIVENCRHLRRFRHLRHSCAVLRSHHPCRGALESSITLLHSAEELIAWDTRRCSPMLEARSVNAPSGLANRKYGNLPEPGR